MKLKKGSKAARNYMARIRAMRGKRRRKKNSTSTTGRHAKVVIKGDKFKVARFMADNGIPFVFQKQAGPNTVGFISPQFVELLGNVLAKHPEYEGRFAKNKLRKKNTSATGRHALLRHADELARNKLFIIAALRKGRLLYYTGKLWGPKSRAMILRDVTIAKRLAQMCGARCAVAGYDELPSRLIAALKAKRAISAEMHKRARGKH